MVADRIKSLREQSGLTQAALAKKLNVTRSAVNSWEMGISIPSTALLVDVARLFHVSTDFLLGIKGSATLDISDLNDEEVLILQRLTAYFLAMKHNNSQK